MVNGDIRKINGTAELKNCVDIKKRLCKIENNWLKAAHFLYDCWQDNKTDANLTVLLIQQMMVYILEIDNGYDEDLHINNNGLNENKDIFYNYLRQAVKFGNSNCSASKYYLWQICYYYKFVYTYYPIMDAENKVKDYKTLYTELLAKAILQFPDSLLFRLMEKDKGNITFMSLSDIEKKTLSEEIRDFDLQNNMADLIVKDYFESMYDIDISS